MLEGLQTVFKGTSGQRPHCLFTPESPEHLHDLASPDSMQGFGRHPRVGITASQTCLLFAFSQDIVDHRYVWDGGFYGGLAVNILPAEHEPQETWVWPLGREDPPQEGMAAHSSVLDWRIPWTEEPGGLQSMRLQRVGHDWSDLTCVHMWDDMLLSKRDRVGGKFTLLHYPEPQFALRETVISTQQFAVGIVWWWRARIPGFKPPFCFSLAG